MARTPSTMLPLGTQAPDFSLLDPDGRCISLADLSEKASAVLVAFICNHCPYVIHIRSQLAALARDYAQRDVAVVGINANDTEAYPQDNADRMREEIQSAGYIFPYVLDPSQEVAQAYRAACTPDFFLFDASLKLVYRGQLDDSRPANGLPTDGRDMRGALDAQLAGKAISAEQKPSIGCNIKWKPGNAPQYG